jgi:hypothetical protein
MWKFHLNLPGFFFILFLLCCGDLAQAQPLSPSPKTAQNFKPMVVSGSAPQPVTQAQLPLAPGETPFPKMLTPYPNISAQTTPAQAQVIVNNVQAIPQANMVPNQLGPLQNLLQGLGGGGAGGAGGMGSGNQLAPNDSGGVSNNYSGIAPRNGNITSGDLDPLAATGGAQCHPPVRSSFEQELGRVDLHASINDVAGYGCNKPSTNRLVCMACNLYFEVDPHDSYEAHVAVARSVMTRAMSSSYPSNVCDVVYQNNGRVAQYSWIFEKPSWNPTHTLPKAPDARLEKVFRAAVEGLQKGPNGFTNYYAQQIVTAKWSRSGSCAATLCRIEHHTFCAIDARQDRSTSRYLAAEGIDATRALASDGVERSKTSR